MDVEPRSNYGNYAGNGETLAEQRGITAVMGTYHVVIPRERGH